MLDATPANSSLEPTVRRAAIERSLPFRERRPAAQRQARFSADSLKRVNYCD
jgi:hypothetical protein